MGNCDSKTTTSSSAFNPNLDIIANKKASQLGEIRLVRQKSSGREMYLKEITLNDKETFEEQLVYYNTRINNPHPNLINVVGYTTEERNTLCSDHYKILVYFDPLSSTLENELQRCIPNKEYISEVQLQLIAEQMITILAEFQRKSIVHGDISPATIYVTEEAYKICDPSFEGKNGANGISKAILLGAKPLLAPELVSKIPLQDIEIRTNKYKADVYSLGATLLSLATLTRSEDLYNYQKGSIDMNLLETRLNDVESMYSPVFSQFLRELLTFTESRRPDFIQLHNKLNIGELIKSYSDHNKMASYVQVPYVKAANNIINSPVKTKSIFNEEYGAKKESVLRSVTPVDSSHPSIMNVYGKQASNKQSYFDSYPLAQSNYYPTEKSVADFSRPNF